MTSRVFCVSEQLWEQASEFLENKVLGLEKIFHLNREECQVLSGDGAEKSPCTTQLWHRDVAIEHSETTSYFRHWFKREGSSLKVLKFSHLALMPLVRSSVWQALLYEFVSGKLCGRNAVRLRVEDELEHYSNLASRKLIKKIGVLSQDWFNLVKEHLMSRNCPLNRVSLGAAEKLVVSLPGLDYRNARRGWSNRKLRRTLAERISHSSFAELKTRKEQEAFVFRYISSNTDFKQDAAKAIIKILGNLVDVETGECILKPWSPEELSEIRREARIRGTADQVMQRALLIQSKIQKGERLTGAERKFKSVHKELFEDVTIQNCFVKENKNYKKNLMGNISRKSVRSQNAPVKENKYYKKNLIPNTEKPRKINRNSTKSTLFPTDIVWQDELDKQQESRK